MTSKLWDADNRRAVKQKLFHAVSVVLIFSMVFIGIVASYNFIPSNSYGESVIGDTSGNSSGSGSSGGSGSGSGQTEDGSTGDAGAMDDENDRPMASNFVSPVKISGAEAWGVDFDTTMSLPVERITSTYGWRKINVTGEQFYEEDGTTIIRYPHVGLPVSCGCRYIGSATYDSVTGGHQCLYGENHYGVDISSDEGEGLAVYDIMASAGVWDPEDTSRPKVVMKPFNEMIKPYSRTDEQRISSFYPNDADVCDEGYTMSANIPTTEVRAVASGTVVTVGNAETADWQESAYIVIKHDTPLFGHTETYSYYGGLYASRRLGSDTLIEAYNTTTVDKDPTDPLYGVHGFILKDTNGVEHWYSRYAGEQGFEDAEKLIEDGDSEDDDGFIRLIYFPTGVFNKNLDTYEYGKAVTEFHMEGRHVEKGEFIGYVGGGLYDPGAGQLTHPQEGYNSYTERHLHFALYTRISEEHPYPEFATRYKRGTAVSPLPYFDLVAKDKTKTVTSQIVAQNRPQYAQFDIVSIRLLPPHNSGYTLEEGVYKTTSGGIITTSVPLMPSTLNMQIPVGFGLIGAGMMRMGSTHNRYCAREMLKHKRRIKWVS